MADFASEAERQELRAAGGVAINQSAQPDLMGDTRSCEAFGDDADHDPEHGGPSVEALNALQLLHVDVAGSSRLEPLIAGLVGLHDAMLD